jgi:hypothetical protein
VNEQLRASQIKRFKKSFSLSASMRQTLADMAASEKTTVVAILYGGAALVDGACEAVGGYLVAKWKMVAAIAVAFGFVQITMAIDPVHFIKL